jgi:hypothetical protein
LLAKDCASSDDCAVTSVYGCCTVYTGIRADAKAAFEAAQAAECQSLSGCGCTDHTETGDPAPPRQPPVSIRATCDVGKCTAHAI